MDDIAQRVRRGQDDGSIATDLAPESAAQQLTALTEGLSTRWLAGFLDRASSRCAAGRHRAMPRRAPALAPPVGNVRTVVEFPSRRRAHATVRGNTKATARPQTAGNQNRRCLEKEGRRGDTGAHRDPSSGRRGGPVPRAPLFSSSSGAVPDPATGGARGPLALDFYPSGEAGVL